MSARRVTPENGAGGLVKFLLICLICEFIIVFSCIPSPANAHANKQIPPIPPLWQLTFTHKSAEPVYKATGRVAFLPISPFSRAYLYPDLFTLATRDASIGDEVAELQNTATLGNMSQSRREGRRIMSKIPGALILT